MTRLRIVIAGLFFTASLSAQTPAPAQPAQPAAPPGPKNIKVLTGLSQAELMTTMHMMRASLGVRCEFCHVETPNGIDFASDANEHKTAAREMIELVKSINDGTFEGRPVVSCYTCHQGSPHPVSLPPLPQTLPAPAAAAPANAPAPPTAESIITAYNNSMKALPPNRTLRGTMTTSRGSVPLEIVQSNGATTITTKGTQGETTQHFSTDANWSSDPRGKRDLSAAEAAHARQAHLGLDLPRLDAKAEGWSKVRRERIGDVEAYRIDRRVSPSLAERFWFHPESGVLLRWMRIESSVVGRVPSQVDYGDYRDVGGAKVPFSIRTSLVDVRSSGEKKFESIEVASGAARTTVAKE